MSEESKDQTWKGKTFREHVAEIRKVVRPSTPEEIDSFARLLESRAAKAEGGPFRASVLSDSGKATEYTAKSFAELWGKVRSHLLEPEARWLEAEISWPKFSSKIENSSRNVKRITLSDDGQRLIKSEAIPGLLPPGTEIPADEPDRLSEWLASLAELLANPLPVEFTDSYYTEAELVKRGVRDEKSFNKHVRETEQEERWRAWIHDAKGKVAWTKTTKTRTEAEDLLQEQPKFTGEGGVEFLERDIQIKDYPAFIPALHLHGDVIRALELIERKGKDSPEAKALELGVRIATFLAEIQTINRAPEILKNTRINRKKPGKGKQKHAKKTEPKSHLQAEIHRIIQEGHDAGNRMWPRDVLDQLEKFRMERDHFRKRKDNHRIRHEKDDESLSVLHLRKTVIRLAIKKICKK
jgi:hypothetical protein